MAFLPVPGGFLPGGCFMMIRLISLVCALVLLLSTSAFAAETLTIDETVTHQTLESFGTSGAWSVSYTHLTLPTKA